MPAETLSLLRGEGVAKRLDLAEDEQAVGKGARDSSTTSGRRHLRLPASWPWADPIRIPGQPLEGFAVHRDSGAERAEHADEAGATRCSSRWRGGMVSCRWVREALLRGSEERRVCSCIHARVNR